MRGFHIRIMWLKINMGKRDGDFCVCKCEDKKVVLPFLLYAGWPSPRSKEKKPSHLVRAWRLTLMVSENTMRASNQPWNIQLCTADVPGITAKGTAQMNCQMSPCSLEWCILQYALQKPCYYPILSVAGWMLGSGHIQELQCWPAWRELTETIICGSQWTWCPSLFLIRDGKPLQFVLQK